MPNESKTDTKEAEAEDKPKCEYCDAVALAGFDACEEFKKNLDKTFAESTGKATEQLKEAFKRASDEGESAEGKLEYIVEVMTYTSLFASAILAHNKLGPDLPTFMKLAADAYIRVSGEQQRQSFVAFMENVTTELAAKGYSPGN